MATWRLQRNRTTPTKVLVDRPTVQDYDCPTVCQATTTEEAALIVEMHEALMELGRARHLQRSIPFDGNFYNQHDSAVIEATAKLGGISDRLVAEELRQQEVTAWHASQPSKKDHETHDSRAATLTVEGARDLLREYANRHYGGEYDSVQPPRPHCETAAREGAGYCSWKNCRDCWAVTAWILLNGEAPIRGYRNG